ncbi:MAG TPA: hypothetical protein VE758_09695 [Chthoniobacterales bacterium]|nr:hypothetical protein [Chthoniobacterales bacterium]
MTAAQHKSSAGAAPEEHLPGCEVAPASYGEGEDVVLLVVVSLLLSFEGEELVLMVVFDSVLVDVAGDGFTIVVLLSFFSPLGGFVTVVSFCSHATRRAAPASMQMYCFMLLSILIDSGRR